MGNSPEPGSPEWVDHDPFADPPDRVEAKRAEVAEAIKRHKDEREIEVAEQNEVSVTFKAHGGYDQPWIVVRGSAEYVAGLLGVPDFTGKVSQIMKQAAKVDAFYKGEIPGGGTGKG